MTRTRQNPGRSRRDSSGSSMDRAERRRRLAIDPLESRTLLTVTSNFAAGLLTVDSDAGDAIVINRSGANILVNGADPMSGRWPPRP